MASPCARWACLLGVLGGGSWAGVASAHPPFDACAELEQCMGPRRSLIQLGRAPHELPEASSAAAAASQQSEGFSPSASAWPPGDHHPAGGALPSLLRRAREAAACGWRLLPQLRLPQRRGRVSALRASSGWLVAVFLACSLALVGAVAWGISKKYRGEGPCLRSLPQPSPQNLKQEPLVLTGPVAARRQSASSTVKAECPHLCQGLVVPSGNDCLLAVRPPPRATKGNSVVDVSDLRGKPVLQAQLFRPVRWGRVDESMLTVMPWNFPCTPAIRLCMPGGLAAEDAAARGPEGGAELAACHLGLGEEGRAKAFLYWAEGRYFGSLAKVPDQHHYALSMPSLEEPLLFEGLFRDHAARAKEESQRPTTAAAALPPVRVSIGGKALLAETEACRMAFDPHGEFYRLRCKGAADVGLVICCLLAIDELEARAAAAAQ